MCNRSNRPNRSSSIHSSNQQTINQPLWDNNVEKKSTAPLQGRNRKKKKKTCTRVPQGPSVYETKNCRETHWQKSRPRSNECRLVKIRMSTATGRWNNPHINQAIDQIIHQLHHLRSCSSCSTLIWSRCSVRRVLSAPPARFWASAALVFSVCRSFRVFSRSSSSLRLNRSCCIKSQKEQKNEKDHTMRFAQRRHSR